MTRRRKILSKNRQTYPGRKKHAFFLLDYHDERSTLLMDIDENNIVGWSPPTAFGMNMVGFVFNGVTWTTLDNQAATYTRAFGIDNGNIVGDYNSHGYLYDGIRWTTLNFPGASNTRALGIDGDLIVGDYHDGSGKHGFIYTIPEPTTLFLLGVGSLAVLRRRKF